MTYWSSVSLISCGVGTCVIASATSRSSSSARISLQSAMHSLQMYTDGPEMNFRTESFDFPQKEQRRCLSLDMEPGRHNEVDEAPGKVPPGLLTVKSLCRPCRWRAGRGPCEARRPSQSDHTTWPLPRS